MIKAVLFDLDGTLLPMNEAEFVKGYFKLLCKKLAPFGYDSDTLIKTILLGTEQIINNDGTLFNQQVFWKVFEEKYGKEKLKDKSIIDEFYLNEFKETKSFCGQNLKAQEIIKTAKFCGFKVILASNPVFPRDGMIVRLGFIGLKESDFDYITSYENSHYAKPNPNYYAEILKNNNIDADEVIFFGNSQKDDFLPASSIGIKTYLVKDFCENKDENNERISLNEIKSIIEEYL